jgi:hypothetical protein
LGDLSEFPLKYKLFLKAYPWRRVDPVPWTALKKPVKDSRLALVSSAGFIKPGQEPFDESIRGGDYSFREIPSDTDVSTLMDTHRSDLYDHYRPAGARLTDVQPGRGPGGSRIGAPGHLYRSNSIVAQRG